MKPIHRLLVAAALVVAVTLALVLTPAGPWSGRAWDQLWGSVLDLPGIAWARVQMQGRQEEMAEAPTANMEEIHALLEDGRASQQDEALEAALGRYREALELDEEYAPSHVALASVYLQLGQMDEAIKEMERAAELAPDEVFVWSRLGEIYFKQDRHSEAVETFERVKTLTPDDGDARYWLGLSYYFRSFDDLEQAVLELERAAVLDPNSPEVSFHLAMAYLRRDDSDDHLRAIAALERVLVLDPAETDVYFQLGQLYLRAEQYDRARQAWQRFVARSQDTERVTRVRVWLDELEESTASDND